MYKIIKWDRHSISFIIVNLFPSICFSHFFLRENSLTYVEKLLQLHVVVNNV